MDSTGTFHYTALCEEGRDTSQTANAVVIDTVIAVIVRQAGIDGNSGVAGSGTA